MKTIRKCLWVLLAGSFLPASFAWAQHPTFLPSGIQHTPGLSSVSGTGLGGLQRSNPYSAGSALQGGGSVNFTRAQMDSYGPGTAGMGGFSNVGGLRGAKATDFMATPGGFDAGASGGGTLNNGLGTVTLKPYLVAMGYSTEMTVEEVITSFVPTEPSLFQTRMFEADTAFRAGKYEDAEATFEMALGLARNAPEVHLSLVQSNVAIRRYHTAAFHLGKALVSYPELPLARIQLRKFYGKDEDFLAQLAALRQDTQNAQTECDFWLVLAYLYYFDESPDEAAKALHQAAEVAGDTKDKDAADAADVFWTGMKAAGKVGGTLDKPTPASQPASGPAATSRPGVPTVKMNPLLNLESLGAPKP